MVYGDANPSYAPNVLGSSLFTATGTAQNFHGDEGQKVVALPFAFPFYGNVYSSVTVNPNGAIYFSGSDPGYVNSLVNLQTHVMIAALWEDLVTYTPHDVYVDTSVPGR